MSMMMMMMVMMMMMMMVMMMMMMVVMMMMMVMMMMTTMVVKELEYVSRIWYLHMPLQELNMPFIVFGCLLAATAYSNVFQFVMR